MSDLDDIARLVHPQADQAQTAARQWAGQVAAFYRGLREQGVGVESATYLTRDYQTIHLQLLLPRTLDGRG